MVNYFFLWWFSVVSIFFVNFSFSSLLGFFLSLSYWKIKSLFYFAWFSCFYWWLSKTAFICCFYSFNFFVINNNLSVIEVSSHLTYTKICFWLSMERTPVPKLSWNLWYNSKLGTSRNICEAFSVIRARFYCYCAGVLPRYVFCWQNFSFLNRLNLK